MIPPAGTFARYHAMELLSFISTEIHKAFKPFFNPKADDAQKAEARGTIEKRLGLIAQRLTGDYLFGSQASVADAYLFVMLRWAQANGATLPAPLHTSGVFRFPTTLH